MRETAPHSLDAAILTFARSWYGYGGGSAEDIYVEFGLPARTYFERLRQILDSPTAANVDEETRDAMRSVCVRRLH
ncbi:DUF3263 domain-containing protein [Rhodococcoides yunnanense]|uniref:DUF3263 domain-containing protein n=1 Tax=Rhodococcoides yunnanense TaxID=278209 RepID=UPI0009332E66|nr:DUF3263 domain-containing protein [Rhodococcus yunnanensis]